MGSGKSSGSSSSGASSGFSFEYGGGSNGSNGSGDSGDSGGSGYAGKGGDSDSPSWGDTVSGTPSTRSSTDYMNSFSLTPELVGNAIGSALGTALGVPVVGGWAGEKVGASYSNGILGDAMDSRSNEAARDAMEDKGISRSDTALAAKHGIATNNSILGGGWGGNGDDDEDDGGFSGGSDAAGNSGYGR